MKQENIMQLELQNVKSNNKIGILTGNGGRWYDTV